ncbi:MAG: hypothetical protein KAT48_09350 [Bacteroidales bacterium]|nr:hypothetical protein [Bacteroidales bacterium]
MMKKNFQTKWFEKNWPLLVILLIAILGIYFRLDLFLKNRSLWWDPAMLAVNLVDKSYHDLLLNSMDYNQSAPAGYLLMQKFIGSFFNYTEYSLIISSFISGILSILLVAFISLKLLPRQVSFLPVLFIAFSTSAIFYSTELKQYSFDLFFTSLIFFSFIKVIKSGWTDRSLLVFTVFGLISTWFSFPSSIILASASFSLILIQIVKKQINRRFLAISFFIGVLFLVNFVLNYIYFVHVNNFMFKYHSHGFVPHLLPLKDFLYWHTDMLKNYLLSPSGFSIIMSGLGILFLFVGLISLWRKQRDYFIFIVSVLFFVYLASALGKYPVIAGTAEIKSRFTLYLIPFTYLLIAFGLYELLFKKYKIFYVFIIFILTTSFFTQAVDRKKTYHREETRPLINFAQRHKKENDKFIIYYASVPAFEYYTRDSKISYIKLQYHRKNSQEYITDLQKLDISGRTWILFSHVYKDEKDIIIDYVTKKSTLLDYKKDIRSYLYLFEFD